MLLRALVEMIPYEHGDEHRQNGSWHPSASVFHYSLKRFPIGSRPFGNGTFICIDTPPEEGRAWGTLFSRFAIRQLPHAYVLDKTGKVAGHGELQQALSKAAGLTK